MFQLTLRVTPTVPLDLDGILPAVLHDLTEVEAARLPIRLGNRVVELGEFFDVELQHFEFLEGPALRIEGDCSFVTNIAAGMTSGDLVVSGSVGPNAASRMSGGNTSIEGNAGDWLGAEVSGGSLWVGGNCGSHVGAARPGSRRGMCGGKIAIDGNAGDGVGERMRRGSIEIKGDCGEFAGAAMIAGTIRVEGRFGANPGSGMKRGTLITRHAIDSLSPGFRYSCEYEPSYLKLLGEREMNRVRCYRGDLLTGGRGELWQVIS